MSVETFLDEAGSPQFQTLVQTALFFLRKVGITTSFIKIGATTDFVTSVGEVLRDRMPGHPEGYSQVVRQKRATPEGDSFLLTVRGERTAGDYPEASTLRIVRQRLVEQMKLEERILIGLNCGNRELDAKTSQVSYVQVLNAKNVREYCPEDFVRLYPDQFDSNADEMSKLGLLSIPVDDLRQVYRIPMDISEHGFYDARTGEMFRGKLDFYELSRGVNPMGRARQALEDLQRSYKVCDFPTVTYGS